MALSQQKIWLQSAARKHSQTNQTEMFILPFFIPSPPSFYFFSSQVFTVTLQKYTPPGGVFVGHKSVNTTLINPRTEKEKTIQNNFKQILKKKK